MLKVDEILKFLDAENIVYSFVGDKELQINGFSSLNQYKEGTFTWAKKQKNIPDNFDLSKIALLFTNETVVGEFNNVIRTAESKRAFFSTIEHFYAGDEERPAVGVGTYISPKVKLGKNVRIGHNCTLDGDITIGDDTIIENNVSIINYCTIGENCLLHSGVVIGTDGFGYSTDENGAPIKVKHFGGTVIGHNTEIGANTCIDRGTIDNTTIGCNVKIDNLVHIAHNCEIEDDCMVITQSAICGSAKLRKKSYIAPGSIIKNQIEIGENAFVGLGAVVLQNVSKDSVVAGVPAKELRKVSKMDK